jgi:hypothetical protein
MNAQYRAAFTNLVYAERVRRGTPREKWTAEVRRTRVGRCEDGIESPPPAVGELAVGVASVAAVVHASAVGIRSRGKHCDQSGGGQRDPSRGLNLCAVANASRDLVGQVFAVEGKQTVVLTEICPGFFGDPTAMARKSTPFDRDGALAREFDDGGVDHASFTQVVDESWQSRSVETNADAVVLDAEVRPNPTLVTLLKRRHLLALRRGGRFLAYALERRAIRLSVDKLPGRTVALGVGPGLGIVDLAAVAYGAATEAVACVCGHGGLRYWLI